MGITETPSSPLKDVAIGLTSIPEKLTLNMFQEIFKCIEPDVKIDKFEEEPASGRGDNYTATLYRVHLSGYRGTETDGESEGDVDGNNCDIDSKKQKWEQSLICKRLPENIQAREAYKSDKLFRNEVEFYTRIIPELKKFQSTKAEQVWNAMPKLFYARPDFLIMEDLRVRGFKMPDRKKGLTVNETEAVLKQVAQLHALSIAYKFENPKKFETLKSLTAEGLFCSSNENWYKNYYERLTKNAVKMVSDVLPADSKYLDAMKSFAESSSFFKKMVDLVSSESTLSAICHGDCWANNFLYRYENTELNDAGGGGGGGGGLGNGIDSKSNTELTTSNEAKVLEVCLVDFQLIRYSSIALDIANLLFCCTSKEMRDEHLDSFVKLYTTEAFRWLKLLCTRIPEQFNTLEKFQILFAKELKTYGRFALGLSMDIIPISTCDSKDAPDLYVNRNNDDIGQLGAPELNFPPNDLCRKKMAEIVIDMVDNGML